MHIGVDHIRQLIEESGKWVSDGAEVDPVTAHVGDVDMTSKAQEHVKLFLDVTCTIAFHELDGHRLTRGTRAQANDAILPRPEHLTHTVPVVHRAHVGCFASSREALQKRDSSRRYELCPAAS